MRFSERREFLYDSEIYGRYDTKTALKINAEYTRKFSPRPLPKIFEVNRDSQNYDPTWRMPLDPRTPYAREIEVPAIVKQEKTKWIPNQQGFIAAEQSARIWFSNLVLQELDYFPVRGDQVYWSGYRWQMNEVILEPDSYWGQTNVWLNVVANLTIAPMGDARPAVNPAEVNPAEVKKSVQRIRQPKSATPQAEADPSMIVPRKVV